MPRPGPRPYECMRRAWHSERHQPMRGSIIRQIFRVVAEAHSAATKSNKEWQEKLPIVVLRAEEIIYSKANSEAEYLNPDTLLDRLNDAINTIIRRDETTETGQLLPPCVEVSDSDDHTNKNNYSSLDTLASVVLHHQPLAVETNPSLSLGSVYPLYYGFEVKEPQLRTSIRRSTCSDTIFVGRPVISPALEPCRMDLLENLSCGRVYHAPKRIMKENAVSVAGESQDGECDLSLRLGICLKSNKASSAYGSEDIGLRVSEEGRKFGHSSRQKNEGYCFYPRGTGYGSI
uniref:Histone acetyltransferase n=1 Tax=Glycine max TaxID=3847 RepID=A0A0R0JSM2_SOYBN